MEKTTNDLQSLLENIHSKEGRKFAISKLAGKADIPMDIVKKFIKDAEEDGWFYGALRVAKKSGLVDKALSLCEEQGWLDEAGKIAKEAGLYDKSQEFYYKAIDTHMKKGETLKAISSAFEGEFKKKIVEIYENDKQFVEAARAAKEIKLTKKAEKLYEKAIEKYEEEKRFYKAGIISQEAGWLQRSLENYIKAEKFDSAAILAKKMGLIDKADELYQRAIKHEDNYSMVSLLVKEFGNVELAIRIKEDKGSYLDAAKIAKEAGLVTKSQRLYEKAVDAIVVGWEKMPHHSLYAARIAKEAGMPSCRVTELYKKCIETYEKQGKLKEVEDVAKEAELWEKVIECCEKKGDFYGAASFSRKIGLEDQAIKYKGLEDLIRFPK